MMCSRRDDIMFLCNVRTFGRVHRSQCNANANANAIQSKQT